MRTDPRCPQCNGKVSATATWCMHCGVDFEAPTERGGVDAALTDALQTGDAEALGRAVGASDTSQTGVAIAAALVALLTLPIVLPPVNFLFVLLAAGAIGYRVTEGTDMQDALANAAQSLAVAPFLLVLVAALLGWAPSAAGLVGPIVYAAIVVAVRRRLTD